MTAGEITDILTIIRVIVAATRYLTQLQFKVRQERIEADKEQAEKRLGDMEARYRELLNEIAVIKRVVTAALTRRTEIDDDLSSIMIHSGPGKPLSMISMI